MKLLLINTLISLGLCTLTAVVSHISNRNSVRDSKELESTINYFETAGFDNVTKFLIRVYNGQEYLGAIFVFIVYFIPILRIILFYEFVKSCKKKEEI